MLAIILMLALGFAGICCLAYLISKEVFINEISELSDGWDFNHAKENEQKTILIIGNN